MFAPDNVAVPAPDFVNVIPEPANTADALTDTPLAGFKV